MQPTEAEDVSGACSKPVIVLLLHGSGDTGDDFRRWLESFMTVEELVPDHAIVLCPTAQNQPYTPKNGHPSRVWFDRPQLSYEEIEDKHSLKASVLELNQLLSSAAETVAEEPIILLFGFSMGGSMALHLAFHRMGLGQLTHGVVVLSSFIGRRSTAILDIQSDGVSDCIPNAPKIKMIHGTADKMVPTEWGRGTADKLNENGFETRFFEVNGLSHQLSPTALREVQTFFSEIVAKAKERSSTG